MIERMKQVCVVTSGNKKEEMLQRLKDLGILHLANRSAARSDVADSFAHLAKNANDLKDFAQKKQEQKDLLSDEEFAVLNEKVDKALQTRTECISKRMSASTELDKISKWGDFLPSDLAELKELGYPFRFFLLGKKELAELSENEEIQYIRLKSVDKMETVAVLGETNQHIPGNEFIIPSRGLSEVQSDIAECTKKIEESEETLKEAAAYLNSYNAQLVKAQNRVEFSSASETADSDEDLVWISGYLPVSEVDRFVSAAKDNQWAWGMDDVIEDDGQVPTKIKYNKVTALMKPIFGLLGTVPGYNEYDISLWFILFFTLFFAMIVGDAAYGCIFLILAIVLHIKSKKMSDIVLLLYVLSIATIAWGAVTGTWFGLEGAMRIPFLKALVIPGIANYPEYFNVSTTAAQNNIMKFCFSIGVVQICLACIMNIRTKLKAKDLSWLADFGWFIATVALYILVLYLVIGQELISLMVVAAVVLAGFLLVVFFGGMAPDKTFAQGLKAGLADAFTTFLNTISAFGNVMSYIRLFAVGMASLAIAQSFNNMGFGFAGSPLIVIGALIIIFGHVLNIVMGMLSVAVHGLRLNLLEFAGQLGMEWSGTEYDPFRELDKVRK